MSILAKYRSTLATVGGCSVTSYLLAEYVFTDEKLANAQKMVRSYTRDLFGMTRVSLPVSEMHAFSLPDSGLHPAHHPWEFAKFNKTYDHAA